MLERFGIDVKVQEAGDGDIVPLAVLLEQRSEIYPDLETAIQQEKIACRTYMGAAIAVVPVCTTLLSNGIADISTGISVQDNKQTFDGVMEIMGVVGTLYALKDFVKEAFIHTETLRILKKKAKNRDDNDVPPVEVLLS